MQRWLPVAVVALSVELWALPVHALEPQSRWEEPALPEAPLKRKRPSVFHRAAEDSPAQQLQYADGLWEQGRPRKALRQYNALVHTWPESAEAVAAQRAYAVLLMERGKFLAAFDELQYLVIRYAGHFPYQEILTLQYQIANQVRHQRFGGFWFFRGARSPERALRLFERIIENAPNWEKAPEVQSQIAQIHEEQGEFDLAVAAYELLLMRYPDAPQASAASFGRAYGRYRLAQSRRRDEEACRQALSALAAFLRDYPGDPLAPAAQTYLAELKDRLGQMYFDRALYYDRTARQPQAARIAYEDFLRNFPSSPLRPLAETRLQALTPDRTETPDEP